MRNLVFSTIVILLLQRVAVGTQCNIESRSGAGNISQYYFEVNTETKNHSEARKFCYNVGGWLGEPRTKELNDGLIDLYKKDSLTCGMFYQGLNKFGGVWTWSSDGANYNNYPNRSRKGTEKDSIFKNCSTHGSALKWYGRNCSKQFRFVCQYKSCSTSADCNINKDCVNSYIKPLLQFCKCKSGYYGKNCTDGYCDAIGNPCQSGGTCVSNKDTTLYRCNCSPGYYGTNCTDEYCDAKENPCQNTGECKSHPGVSPYYTCNCSGGYFGDTCAKGYCEEHPATCKNGGTCTSNHTAEPYHRCNCLAGYNGSNCAEANSKKTSSNTSVIAAAAVGGGLIVLLSIIPIALLRRKRVSLRKLERSSDTELSVLADTNANQTTEKTAKSNEPLKTAQERSSEPIYQNQGYEGKEDIAMEELNIYNSKQRNQSSGFSKEFQEVLRNVKGFSLTSDFAANPAFKSKNRYKNIVPFDNTRVPLISSKDHYINACFIDGYEQKKKFIATQGPLKKTVNDFWQMIVEQESTVIVMLAKCVEAGKAKCEKYWPDLGATCLFGSIEITNSNETRSCGFVCRSLKVTATANDITISRVVSQYHFLKWPDHGFPITTSYLMQMYRKVVERHQMNESKSPIVVHCSAGAGRTGTFIGYDILLNESKSTGKADLFNCVINMRMQRMDMVQNRNQYILIHKLLLECHLFGDTDIAGRVVPETFSDSHYKSKMAREHFQNLSKVTPMDMLNKNGVLSAYDRMRIKIQNAGVEVPNQLEASYVEVYDESTTVIVTKEPRRADVNAFYRLLATSNVSTIVMITEKERESFPYWNEDVFSISSEESIDQFMIRKLLFTSSEIETCVTHILLELNAQTIVARDVNRMNDCIKRMIAELRETSGVALVHCKNGMGMSGVFCAVMNLLERLKVEDRVDVFRAVKDLRDCREGMVESMKQYELCHDAILAYLQDFDTYSNFK